MNEHVICSNNNQKEKLTLPITLYLLLNNSMSY